MHEHLHEVLRAESKFDWLKKTCQITNCPNIGVYLYSFYEIFGHFLTKLHNNGQYTCVISNINISRKNTVKLACETSGCTLYSLQTLTIIYQDISWPDTF